MRFQNSFVSVSDERLLNCGLASAMVPVAVVPGRFAPGLSEHLPICEPAVIAANLVSQADVCAGPAPGWQPTGPEAGQIRQSRAYTEHLRASVARRRDKTNTGGLALGVLHDAWPGVVANCA